MQSVNAQMAAASRQFQTSSSAMAESVRKQKLALDQQTSKPASASPPAKNVFFSTVSLLPERIAEPEVLRCDALPQPRVDALVEEASRSQDVNPDLLRAVMQKESAFYPCAISSKGALGLMQLMPGTADSLGVADVLDPVQNVTAGAKLLHSLLDRYSGDLGLTLGAYNAGPAKVDAAGGIPEIPETAAYVRSILSNLGMSAQQD